MLSVEFVVTNMYFICAVPLPRSVPVAFWSVPPFRMKMFWKKSYLPFISSVAPSFTLTVPLVAFALRRANTTSSMVLALSDDVEGW